MSEEYLWNREGEADPEVAGLEKLLAPLRHNDATPLKRSYRSSWWLAAAAVFIMGAAALGFTLTRGPLTSWQTADGHRLRAGQLIESAPGQAAVVESESTGRIEVEPGSRFRLRASGKDEQRFHLERGVIHALIWAPPGHFVVDTPSAKTTDLGCRYSLQVSEDGSGLLSVETGWVAFEHEKVESFIPAGAACVTRPARGPGTPWFQDAPESLRKALDSFDIGGNPEALAAVVREARERDGLTLWHLLVRTRGQERAEVYDRFASLVHLPAAVTREAVLRGDPEALDAAWNALDLGSTEWWREWKRKW